VAFFHNNLGEAYRALDRISNAIDCYRRALELKPDYAEAHSNLGLALKEQGKLDDALACYRRALLSLFARLESVVPRNRADW
jgi:tetratricopeptide (TPR) repeat protein